ncbi:MAG: hypothetical protein WDO68_22020 [Gammaproteobacteria bacterium]
MGQGAAKPLPVPGTPLKQAIAELKARAGAGEAAAASRLFEDLKTCEESWRIEHIYGKPTKAANPAVTLAQQRLSFAQANAALCAGVGEAEFSEIVPTTLLAAGLGDQRAIDCYVARGFLGSGLMTGVLTHPVWLSDYKKNVVELAEVAVRKGDWNVVRRLQQAYSGKTPGFDINLLNEATGTDPVQAYRYLKLQQLGSNDPNGETAQKLADAASAIGPEDQRKAHAWAEQTYQHYFHTAMERTAPDVMTCGI